MTPSAAKVTLRFSSDWLASTGGSGGGDVDDVVQRGLDGLPVVPMSSVKGVLREAASRLAAVGGGGWTTPLVETLFGRRSAASSGTREGSLVFAGDARLALDERTSLAGAAGRPAPETGELFVRRAATAIDRRSGAARAHTLRAIEAAVPMTLVGRIRVRPDAQAPADWVERLDAAAVWTLGIGKAKADGLGRVDISVEENDTQPSASATARAKAGAKSAPGRLILLLEQTEKAAFSLRSATEGAHETRLAVPGSALLGWAARRYDAFKDPFAVFHSGAVRFGDARPVGGPDDELLWPTPQAIIEPKHARTGVDADGGLTDEALVRRPDGKAYDRIKPRLVTRAGRTAKSRLRLSLRTAMRDGRPETGLLFGYTSLESSPDDPACYVALIEREVGGPAAICDDDWTNLRACFDGAELQLGRAAAAGQGGCFRVSMLDDQDLWPPVPDRPHEGRVVVWALSDLALVDEAGEPDLEPDAERLGLGVGRLVASESAISTRRYAPWRGHIASRDPEHAVIEAGSVLVFDVKTRAATWPSVVGLHRELGLGRIAIDPPLLENLAKEGGGDAVQRVASEVRKMAAGAARGATAGAKGGAATAAHAAWARARRQARRSYSKLVETFETSWRPELERLYAADLAGEGPSRSQWRDADLGEADMEALRAKLFDGPRAVCARPAWRKTGRAVGKGRVALADWLQAQLAGVAAVSEARALIRMAADTSDAMARAAREKRP